MRFIYCLLSTIVSGSFLELAPACVEVEEIQKYDQRDEDPEGFRELVTECIGMIDKVLSVDNWKARFNGIIRNLIMNQFFEYDTYDDDSDDEYRDGAAEEELNEGKWTPYLTEIALGISSSNDLIEPMMDCYTSHYGSERIEESLFRDARDLAQVLESHKPLLRVRKELLQLELDTRRRSRRLADKKRKQAEADLSI